MEALERSFHRITVQILFASLFVGIGIFIAITVHFALSTSIRSDVFNFVLLLMCQESFYAAYINIAFGLVLITTFCVYGTIVEVSVSRESRMNYPDMAQSNM